MATTTTVIPSSAFVDGNSSQAGFGGLNTIPSQRRLMISPTTSSDAAPKSNNTSNNSLSRTRSSGRLHQQLNNAVNAAGGRGSSSSLGQGVSRGSVRAEEIGIVLEARMVVTGDTEQRRKPRPTRESVLRRLSEALMRRSLITIDMSQRGLCSSDARLVKLALLQNKSLSVLKLGYNNLGDEGVTTLASGIAGHGALSSLDLGFNNVGDVGCNALASALLTARGTLHTLYLAGNCIGFVGANSLATLLRVGCRLQRLHLTGNRIGPEGVKVISEAVAKGVKSGTSVMKSQGHDGLHELFLGGTGVLPNGFPAVGMMLQRSSSLRVLSLANCGMDDAQLTLLADSIKQNRELLPIESLQLSFNNLTCKGIEPLMNALWGSSTLRELRLDNNSIGDRGAQVVSAVLTSVKSLKVLDIGFNDIQAGGMKTLMKSVAENEDLTSLSIAGIKVNTGAAKAVAYALAYNHSLKSLFLDHCSVGHEGQRHITAGIVSNCRTSLHTLTGFLIGGTAVSLGFPTALDNWTNEQVLKFIHLMWERTRQHHQGLSVEKALGPLQVPGNTATANGKQMSGPLDPTTVVDVAKRAFASLGDNGSEVLSRQPGRPLEPPFESPLAEDAVMLEADDEQKSSEDDDPVDTLSTSVFSSMDVGERSLDKNGQLPSQNPASRSSVSQSTPATTQITFSARKKRIVEWLCENIHHLNDLSNMPFNSSELWRLHQHYFTPLINEVPDSPSDQFSRSTLDGASHSTGDAVMNSTLSEPHAVSQSSQCSEHRISVPVSEPVIVPMLKRKVSYRFLHESLSSSSRCDLRREDENETSVSKLIEGLSSNSMQPKCKRARKNKARITFLPRIKAKLDSHLESCHHKALILMRQLQYVERSLLSGIIYCVSSNTSTHLSGTLATDAEMILIDMV